MNVRQHIFHPGFGDTYSILSLRPRISGILLADWLILILPESFPPASEFRNQARTSLENVPIRYQLKTPNLPRWEVLGNREYLKMRDKVPPTLVEIEIEGMDMQTFRARLIS
jgi:hypothetical protein